MIILGILAPFLLLVLPSKTLLYLAFDILALIGLSVAAMMIGGGIAGVTASYLFGSNLVREFYEFYYRDDNETSKTLMNDFFFLAMSCGVSVALDALIIKNIFDVLNINFRIVNFNVLLEGYYFSLLMLQVCGIFVYTVGEIYIFKENKKVP